MTPHELEMDPRHNYKCVAAGHENEACHGKTFKSVTTILGKAVPKNLAWHGQTRGVIGVKGLLKLQKYPHAKEMRAGDVLAFCKAEGISPESARTVTPADKARLGNVPKYDIWKMSADAITEALKREKLTVNSHLKQAGERGTGVHKALEDYATKGAIPVASTFPENDRGYIRGLAKFIVEYKPECVGTEIRVLSTEHSFAGTFDLLATIAGRSYLIDLKTAKWVYPASHFPQLEAYEGARIEAGERPTDVRAVLWVNSGGHMELVPSSSTFADFLALKASADVIQRLDSSWKRPRKVAA